MSYDSDQHLLVPRRALSELAELTLPEALPYGSALELVVRLDDTAVNLRELAAFLAFIDRSYGRLSPEGLNSYSHKREAQAEVSLESGSLQVVLDALAEREAAITSLVVLRLLLKNLPTAFKEVASGYREIQEARLTTLRAKQLREQLKADADLARLDGTRRNQLVRLMDDLYQRENNLLPRVQRFSLRYLREVYFRVRPPR